MTTRTRAPRVTSPKKAALADGLDLTAARLFKTDAPRIQRLGGILEARERASFASQHTLSRALDALEKELAAETAATA